MIELRKEDMLNINGGANAILITTIIGTIITFIVGTLKGYSNPEKCNILGGNCLQIYNIIYIILSCLLLMQQFLHEVLVIECLV